MVAQRRCASAAGLVRSSTTKGGVSERERNVRREATISTSPVGSSRLWACERRYSADDHWTLKDAFEVSTMELRDQFIGAFSESFKASKKREAEEFDDMDDMAAGRMRGRGRKH